MNLLIKNGKIITHSDEQVADILISEGKIKNISPNLNVSDEVLKKGRYIIIDAKEHLVLPGAVDAHTHFELPILGTFSADSCVSGSIAAACGGVTTFIDYCTQEDDKSIFESLDVRRGKFEKFSAIDFTLHLTVNNVSEKLIKDLHGLKAYGVSSVKLFTAYKNMMINDEDFEKVLEKSKVEGFLVTVHAENQDEIDKNIERLVDENTLKPWNHYESRPESVEASAVKRVLEMVEKLDTDIYFVHLSSKESLDLIIKSKKAGFRIFAETCPQYLNFNNEVYNRHDAENFICSPPIKGEASRKALWAGIADGYIDTVATDHCPFNLDEKRWGKEDFRNAPNGCMGVENLYPFILSKANSGEITFSKAVELCSTNPARIFGCYPKKGTIAVGSDADIVIYDPGKVFTITKEKMHSDVDYTIWEGIELKGYPIVTISRGKIIYKDGTFTGAPGWGKFVKCALKKHKGEKK